MQHRTVQPNDHPFQAPSSIKRYIYIKQSKSQNEGEHQNVIFRPQQQVCIVSQEEFFQQSLESESKLISSHSQRPNHNTQFAMAVLMCNQSLEILRRWTDFSYKKFVEYKELIEKMGYSKVFEMKLDNSHPKGTVGQLNFAEIEEAIQEALRENTMITEGNWNFVNRIKVEEIDGYEDLLKDIFNVVTEDAKTNLEKLPMSIQNKLITKFPNKEIYKFTKFLISPRQIVQFEHQRNSLLKQYGEQILLKRPNSLYESPKKPITLSNSRSSERIGFQQKQLGSGSLSQLQNQPTSPSSNSQRQSSSKPVSDYIDREVLNRMDSTPTRKNIIPEDPKHATEIAILKANHEYQESRIKELEQENRTVKAELERKKTELLEERKKLSALSTSSPNKMSPSKSKQEMVKEERLKQQLQNTKEDLQASFSRIQDLERIIEDKEGFQKEQIAKQSSEIVQLKAELSEAKASLVQKQQSIRELNNLISNEETEIQYRENEVAILGGEIRKLLDRIQFLEQSIRQLNNLISNEEQELTYRENEVSLLGGEIKNLLKRIEQLENSIKGLNQLIANEQEELSYRENESEILTKEVKKLIAKIKGLEQELREAKENNALQGQSTSAQGRAEVEPDDALVEQVVAMEAEAQEKDEDIRLLIDIVQNMIASNQKEEVIESVSQRLKNLRTIAWKFE